MKYMNERESLSGFLRDLDIRLNRVERHSHHGAVGSTVPVVSGADEVWIGAVPPLDPGIELWYEPSTTPSPSGAQVVTTLSPSGAQVAQQAARTSIPSVPEWPSIVVKATTPTAADYGRATIPLNAVWIQAPGTPAD